jgi:O-antigen ligase/tetratricopeptide (TPR) repeat protein
VTPNTSPIDRCDRQGCHDGRATGAAERVAPWGLAVLWSLGAAAPLAFSTGNVDPFLFVKATLLAISAAVAGTAALLSSPWPEIPREARSSRPRSESLIVGLAVCVISASLSAAFGISPLTAVRGAEGSSSGLLTIASLFVLFFATDRLVRTEREERQLLSAIPVAVVGVGVYALVQFAGLDPFRWTRTASLDGRLRPFSTLGHPNYMAAWLAVAAPIVALALYRAVRWGKWVRAVMLSTALGLACAAVVVSLSRGGWIAAAAGVGVFVALVPRPRMNRSLQKRRLVLAAFLITVVAGLGVFSPGMRDAVRARAERIGDVGARKELWAASVRILRRFPLLGSGPDTFALAFQKERTREFRRIECDRTPTQAHNDILQLLATHGSIGLAAFSLVVVQFWRRFRPTAGKGSTGWSDRRAAFTGAFTAFALQAVTGFTVLPTAILVVMILALSLRSGVDAKASTAEGARAIRNGPGCRKRSEVVALTAKLLAVGLAGVVSVGSLRAFVADRLWRRATLSGTGSIQAVDLLGRAEVLDPYRDALEVAFGEAARQAALTIADPVERDRLRSVAEAACVRATRLVPEDGHGWIALARLQWDRFRDGQVSAEEVDRAFQDALARDPLNPAYLYNAAEAAVETGNLDKGWELAERNATFYPDLGPPLGQLALIEALRGRVTEARVLYERSLDLDWCGRNGVLAVTLTNAARAAASAGDFAEAADLARRAVDAQPDSAAAHHNLAERLEDLGRREDARREYEAIVHRFPQQVAVESARRRLEVLR